MTALFLNLPTKFTVSDESRAFGESLSEMRIAAPTPRKTKSATPANRRPTPKPANDDREIEEMARRAFRIANPDLYRAD